jgi:hypothetical protein
MCDIDGGDGSFGGDIGGGAAAASATWQQRQGRAAAAAAASTTATSATAASATGVASLLGCVLHEDAAHARVADLQLRRMSSLLKGSWDTAKAMPNFKEVLSARIEAGQAGASVSDGHITNSAQHQGAVGCPYGALALMTNDAGIEFVVTAGGKKPPASQLNAGTGAAGRPTNQKQYACAGCLEDAE